MSRTTKTTDETAVSTATPEETEGFSATPETAAAVEGTEGGKSEFEQLREQMGTMLKLYKDAQEQMKMQNEVIQELRGAIADANKKILGEVPEDVLEREKSMKDIVEVTVTKNPLDPSIDVPYIDPHTGKACKIQKGVKTKVSRAVYEILEHSMRMDDYSTVIATEKAKAFEEAEGKLSADGTN